MPYALTPCCTEGPVIVSQSLAALQVRHVDLLGVSGWEKISYPPLLEQQLEIATEGALHAVQDTLEVCQLI